MHLLFIDTFIYLDDDWLITGSDDFNIYGWNTRNVSNVNDSIDVREESNTRFKFVGTSCYLYECDLIVILCIF